MNTAYKDLAEKQNYSLEQKIKYTENVIREFAEHFDNKMYIGFSGGLDSRVLVDIVRRIYPDTVAVFCNTTNEDPLLVKFVKTIPNVITVKPKINFKEFVSEYGFPFVSKQVSRSISDLRNPHSKNPNIRNLYLTGLTRENRKATSYKLAKKWYFLFDKESTPFSISSKCCDILKKEPLKRFQKESGLFPISGTLASESTQRKKNYLKYGDNILNSKEPKSRPLSIWTDDDIWSYINKYKLSYCELYDDTELEDGTIVKGETTTGCVGCGMGCDQEENSRFESLKLRRPRLHKNIMRITHNGITYEKALNHYLNPPKEFTTKEYQNKMYQKGIDDLKGCNVICNQL